MPVGVEAEGHGEGHHRGPLGPEDQSDCPRPDPDLGVVARDEDHQVAEAESAGRIHVDDPSDLSRDFREAETWPPWSSGWVGRPRARFQSGRGAVAWFSSYGFTISLACSA